MRSYCVCRPGGLYSELSYFAIPHFNKLPIKRHVLLLFAGMLPGEFKHRGKYQKSFFDVEGCIEGCISEADCIVYLVDGTKPLYKQFIPKALAHLVDNDIPKLLVFNKVRDKFSYYV